MEKPKYNKESLIRAIEKCNINIKAFEEGIQKEMNYKRELQGYVAEHEQYEREKRG